MSQIRISNLANLPSVRANSANTLLVGVDIPSGITGKITAQSLAQQLYANNYLVVGQNAQTIFSNTIAQFSGFDPAFIQVNLQNFNPVGSGDYIITADTGTNSNAYIDLGIQNSQATGNNAGFGVLNSYDGYLLVQGPNLTGPQGNLIIGAGSTNSNIYFLTGGGGSFNQNNIVATMSANIATFNTAVTAYGVLNVGPGTGTLPNLIAQFTGVSNNYTQINLSNMNQYGTADYIITADIGNDTNYYLDIGYTNSTYDNTSPLNGLGSSIEPLAGYIYVAGNAVNNAQGNLVIGTIQAGTETRFISGGVNSNNVIMKIKSDGIRILGNLVANTVNSAVSFNNVTSNNATFSRNLTVLGTITANTLQGNVFFSNITTITTQANTLQWFSQATAPTQSPGQVWYSANGATLVEDTEIAGDRILIGKVLFERVYNSRGATIPAGSWVRLSGAVTANAIPYIDLADAASAANSVVSGYTRNAIANGAYGYIYIAGIVDNLNTSVYGNGDNLFLSTTPGTAQNTAPSGANNSVQLAKVLSNSSTTGKLQVSILPAPQFGKQQGAVIYANNNILVSSNTISINDSTSTVNITGNIIMTGTILMNNATFPATSYAVGIVGSAGGATQPPIADGTMLQITGKDGINSKVIVDAAGTGVYSLFNGRAMRGTAASPTALQSGDTIVRFGGNGFGTTGFGSGVGVGGAYIQYVAQDNFTDNTKGTNIVFATTPANSNTILTALTITGNTATFANNVVVANTLNANVIFANTVTANVTSSTLSLTGTWTPNIAFVTSNGTISYTSNTGIYVKTGRQVTAYFTIVATQTGNSGNTYINGLPFTAITSNGSVGITTIGGYLGGPSSANMGPMSGNVVSGATSTQLFVIVNTGNGSMTNQPVTNATLGSPFTLNGMVSYISAS